MGTINERIKKMLMDDYKGNVSEFSRISGIPQTTLNNIVANRMSKPSADNIALILNSDESINARWLLTGEGEMLEPKVNILHNPPYRYQKSDNEIALYDIDAAANLKTLFENKKQNVIGSIRIPDMPLCDGAISIRGDSMYPLLKAGDIVIYKEVPHFDNLIFGEMYLIDFSLNGDPYLVVKYIKRSDISEHIMLVSYNSHHDPIDIPLSGIRAMALIKASIRYNTMI